MKTTLRFLVTTCVLSGLTVVPCAAKSGGGVPGDGPVKTTVSDTDASGSQVLLRSDAANGGSNLYTSVNNVSSSLYGGVLFLRMYSQSLRTLWITPNDTYNQPPNPPVAIPPAAYYWQYVELYVKCTDGNGNLVYLENVVTSNSNCRLGVDFGYGGVKYKLDMGPVQPAPGPATGSVKVQCNSVSGGLCVNWTVTPYASSANAGVANLYYYAQGGKLTYIGQYYNSFNIGVTY